uniref:Discoidin domain-containing receptor 2 n=1 Tax=Cacopsylla melanoneura TaxID=428564 RepID=A0A8D9E443_9HEMI
MSDLCLTFVFILFLSSTILSSEGESSTQEECRSPLGMEEGKIPDHAITASSSYELKSVGPQNARIRNEKNGGAWCPKAQISSDVHEYLEINLMRSHLITLTETQGRFGNGQGQEYAEGFLVEYWRDSLNRWIIYNENGSKILSGNINTYLEVRQELVFPFVAQKVRFIPYSVYPRTVCMRVELYGCTWEQNLISYSVIKPDTEFSDLSYDGDVTGRMLTKGLGQLADGLYGADDFILEDHLNSFGSRWVGWPDDLLNGHPLEIVFEFDSVQAFSSMSLHTNHLPTRDVQVFSAVKIFFSLDGKVWQSNYSPVKETPNPDLFPKNRTAFNVVVGLKNRVSRFAKVQLYFKARWILLSEVSFDSNTRNLTEDLMTQYYAQDKPVRDLGDAKVTINHHRTTVSSQSPDTVTYVGVIAGMFAMILLVLGCTVLFLVRRGRKKVALLHKHSALMNGTTPGVTMNMKEMQMHMTTPIIKPTNTNKTIKKSNKIYGVKNMVGEESEDSENSSLYHEPYKLMSSGKQEYGCLISCKKTTLTSSKSNGDCTDFTSVNSFNVGGIGGEDGIKFSSPCLFDISSNLHSTGGKPNKRLNKSMSATLPLENYYAATDIIKTERREQHLTPGKFTPLKLPDGQLSDCHLLEIARQRLRIIEKLGEGRSGLLHLCETDGIPVDSSDGTSTYHKKHQVLVKSLWRASQDSTKKEFIREATWMCSLKDPNLVRVIGVCSTEDPISSVQEYCEFGDLSTFLQIHNCNSQDNPAISYGCLIFMATQIASGMKYLESRDIVHRDLSARNCMVGKNYLIKISDHAMYCSHYESDYYLSDTKSRLPIRWMAWESLLLGKNTTKSDVWSFAVTLWEILVHCNQRPYAELTNEQVIENCSHWYQSDGLQKYLPRPSSCQKEIFDLMLECWKTHDADRPRFSEIHLFLQRKNLGFVPTL